MPSVLMFGDARIIEKRFGAVRPYAWPEWDRFTRFYAFGLFAWLAYYLGDGLWTSVVGQLEMQWPLSSRGLMGWVIEVGLLGLTIGCLGQAYVIRSRFRELTWDHNGSVDHREARAEFLRRIAGVTPRTVASLRRWRVAGISGIVFFLASGIPATTLTWLPTGSIVKPLGASLIAAGICGRFLYSLRTFNRIFYSVTMPNGAASAVREADVVIPEEPIANGVPITTQSTEPSVVRRWTFAVIRNTAVRWFTATLLAAIIQVYVERFLR